MALVDVGLLDGEARSVPGLNKDATGRSVR